MLTETLTSVLIAVTGAVQTPSCGMERIAVHADAARTMIRAAISGEPSTYFHAKMDVNTDGASRSYHPDDPRGRTLALNNIGNAITDLRDAQGRDIDCSPRSGACFTRYITTFEAARNARWNPDGHPRVATTHIIPWRMDPALGWRTPCLNSAGYFVSQTSFIIDPARSECDQERYLDALKFNAVVLPGGTAWRSQGWKADKGDLVVVRDRVSGRTAFAIVGDAGPATNLGEGTALLAATLGGQTLQGSETYAAIRALARRDVDYLVLNSREIRLAIQGGFTQANVDRLGRDAFQAWGGAGRLDACRALG